MNAISLDDATEEHIACEFLRRLGFGDATEHTPKRTAELLQLLADACGILLPYGRGARIDKQQFAMQLGAMAQRIGAESNNSKSPAA
jgi:hypothetical protein